MKTRNNILIRAAELIIIAAPFVIVYLMMPVIIYEELADGMSSTQMVLLEEEGFQVLSKKELGSTVNSVISSNNLSTETIVKIQKQHKKTFIILSSLCLILLVIAVSYIAAYNKSLKERDGAKSRAAP